MAAFVTNLWESIFTPGPTPTLLVATNVTFAALQVLLLVLLVATYSIHFAILSVLSGGLWYSVNWFARELALHAEQEAEKARLAAASAETPAAPGTTDDSDTEVEGAAGGASKKNKPAGGGAGGGGSSQAETLEQRKAADLKRRVAAAAERAEGSAAEGTQSSVSTEDEWEKVSENEKDK
ncbi:V-type ATPase assembly factor PKR1 [Colletotrichum spinosum]|uniref:V-type ATPase assembly factor PKR1 n=1 Tax=Colletotrichum spinosum TaxID=1347390 RepID=A0A4V3HQK2_9PEZI|nr:V-type ATPase assembly factor PKR1 [Colletotrichum spinosum]